MPEHIPYTNCSQQGDRIRIPDQSGFCFTGLQYYNSNLCSHQGTLFTRTFLSTAIDWVAWVEKCRSGRLGRGGKGHSLSGKWKTRRLAAETEMKPNGTRKTNLQNENAKHSRWRGGCGWKSQHPHGIRLAICLSQGSQNPPLPSRCPNSNSPNSPNIVAVAVAATCFIYCFFNPFFWDSTRIATACYSGFPPRPDQMKSNRPIPFRSLGGRKSFAFAARKLQSNGRLMKLPPSSFEMHRFPGLRFYPNEKKVNSASGKFA